MDNAAAHVGHSECRGVHLDVLEVRLKFGYCPIALKSPNEEDMGHVTAHHALYSTTLYCTVQHCLDVAGIPCSIYIYPLGSTEAAACQSIRYTYSVCLK